LLATIRFRVTNPRVYLFEVSDAEEIIRSATESELRAMVAGRKFADLLTVDRERFQADVLRRVARRCTDLSTTGLGVELDGISIIDLHPPSEVVDAYYEVAKAMERKEQRINEAKEQAIRIKKQNEADVTKIRSVARAEKEEKLQEADKDRLRFEALFRPRSELPLDVDLDYSWRAAKALFAGESFEEAVAKPRSERDALLKLQPGLTDFRHYWNAVAKALTGRDLLLIDADKINIRRNLMLFDPELFRAPPPIFMRPDPELRPPFRPGTPKDDH
ncbi:MAG: hypothetical protein HYR84_04885, partial [Planctomycetes bacterium]|nr:hypothetical protein [Planctomycetota bacterium]